MADIKSEYHEYKEFHEVTVYSETKKYAELLERNPHIEINWSCKGPVPIEEAEVFSVNLIEAIKYAKNLKTLMQKNEKERKR